MNLWILLHLALVARVWTRKAQPVVDDCLHLIDLQTLVPRVATNSELDVCRPAGNDGTERSHCCNRLIEDRMEDLASKLFVDMAWDGRLMSFQKKINLTVHSLLEPLRHALSEVSRDFHSTTKYDTNDRSLAHKHSWLTVVHMYAQTAENTLPQDHDLYHIVTDSRDNVSFTILPYVESQSCRIKFWKFLQQTNTTRALSRIRLVTSMITASEKLAQVAVTLRRFAVLPECRTALTRMNFCSKCDFRSLVVPCRNLCHNVLSGCWLPVYQALHKPWNHLVRDLDEMRKGIGNVHELLRDVSNDVISVFRSIQPVKEDDEEVLQTERYCRKLFKPRKLPLPTKAVPRFIQPIVDLSRVPVELSALSSAAKDGHSIMRHMPSMLCKLLKKKNPGKEG